MIIRKKHFLVSVILACVFHLSRLLSHTIQDNNENSKIEVTVREVKNKMKQDYMRVFLVDNYGRYQWSS